MQFGSNDGIIYVTVCLSMYPTITTQRLCCSGSATGIGFGMYVTDPVLNFVCNGCMDYDGILLVILLQQAAAAAAYGQCDFHRQPGGQQQY